MNLNIILKANNILGSADPGGLASLIRIKLFFIEAQIHYNINQTSLSGIQCIECVKVYSISFQPN